MQVCSTCILHQHTQVRSGADSRASSLEQAGIKMFCDGCSSAWPHSAAAGRARSICAMYGAQAKQDGLADVERRGA